MGMTQTGKFTREIKIEDSKGERSTVTNFRSRQAIEAHRQALRTRVETGATITISEV